MVRSEAVELLEVALTRFGDSQAGVLNDLWDRPSRRVASSETSRQARHARLVRNRTTAVMGAMALAARETEFARLMLGPEIARLRPYSAAHHMKVIHLAETTPAFSRRDCEALWELGAGHLLRLGRRGGATDGGSQMVVGNILCTLFVGPGLHGAAFADEWRSLWKAAKRAGLLQSRFYHLQLSMMGSFVGDCGHHVDWLMNPRNWSFEMADILGFVRRGIGNQALSGDIDRINDRQNEATSLSQLADSTVLGQLATYVRGVMRDSHHFSNEGQALMVLIWIESLARHLQANGSHDLDEDMTRLFVGLEKIERVQQLEKSRFFRLWEPLSGGPVKDRLIRLWSRSYTTSEGGAPLD
jgi:hypothetical protein